MKTYKAVLQAKLLHKTNERFFYEITGSEEWLSTYESQEKPYARRNELGNLVHSFPWYYGRECILKVNDYNNNVFFDINEHETNASRIAPLKDYWVDLANQTGEEHWLTRSKSSKNNNQK